MATEKSFYWLDPRLERRAVYFACSSPRFWSRGGNEMEAENLNAEEARWALRAAKLVATEYTAPSSFILVLQRLRSLMDDGKVSYAEVGAVGDYLLAGEADEALSEEDVMSQLAPVLQKRLANRAVVTAMQEASAPVGPEGPFPEFVKLVERSKRVGSAVHVDVGTVLGEGSYDVIEAAKHHKRLSTGIEDLDARLDGGPRRGGFTIWLGATNTGKSAALLQRMARALSLGFTCALATLELTPEEQFARLKANLTGIPTKEILDNPTCCREWFDNNPIGRGYLQAFPSHATTVTDLRDWVDNIELAEGARLKLGRGQRNPIDLLLIDYGDLLVPPATAGKRHQDSGYGVGMHVFGELRTYAEGGRSPGDGGHPGGPIWVDTACAATRSQGHGKARPLGTDDIADSIHKSRRATLMISINPTEDGMTMFYVAKNSHGPAKFEVGPLPSDFACARIAPVFSLL